MPDLFEELFDFPDFNAENETPTPLNAEADLAFLDDFFELIEDMPSSASSLIRLHNQLKNNQSKDAIQTIRDNPHCLQQINDVFSVNNLAKFRLFFLLLLRQRLVPIIKSMWESNSQLASYFSGNPIQVQVINEQGVLETQTW